MNEPYCLRCEASATKKCGCKPLRKMSEDELEVMLIKIRSKLDKLDNS